MRLTVDTKVTFQQKEVVALASSGILAVSVADALIGREQAYLLSHIRPESANVITATSSAGHEMECLTIEDGEWTFRITKEPEEEVCCGQ